MKRANNKQDILQSLWSLGEPELAASLESMLREGIMDDGSVREIIAMKQKQKVLAIHSYAVGQMKGNDTRWYTYVIDSDTGKRKKVVAPTEAELYRKLFYWYFENEIDDIEARKALGPALIEVYDEWIRYRLATVNRAATVRRNETDFRRFFLEEPLSQKVLITPLSQLKKPDWEMWAYELIHKYHLTKTAYNNVACIVRQVYEYLCDKEVLQANPFSRVRIRANTFRKERKKPAVTQVFSDREKAAVIEEACRRAEAESDANYLIIPLCFLTGLRVGEILALTYSDFDFVKHTLDVHRSFRREDVRDEDGKWSTPVYRVHDQLKGNADERIIVIDSRVASLVKTVRKLRTKDGSIDEHLFPMKTPNGVNIRLYRICDDLGIPRRSIHKARKTYASDLLNAHLDPDFVRTQLGHSELRTTLNSYIYSTTASDELLQRLEKAL